MHASGRFSAYHKTLCPLQAGPDMPLAGTRLCLLGINPRCVPKGPKTDNLGARIVKMLNLASGRPVTVKQLPEKLSVQQGRLFFREVESCLNSDRPRVVFDCSKVQQLDSAGIHLLLNCLEEAMKRNGDVKLAAISPRAAATLELTKVDRLFETFNNIADAVNSFNQLPAFALQQALGHEHSPAESQSAA
jgi:anti-sigma B factor antagonist